MAFGAHSDLHVCLLLTTFSILLVCPPYSKISGSMPGNLVSSLIYGFILYPFCLLGNFKIHMNQFNQQKQLGPEVKQNNMCDFIIRHFPEKSSRHVENNMLLFIRVCGSVRYCFYCSDCNNINTMFNSVNNCKFN